MHKSVAYITTIFIFYLLALLCFSTSAFALPFNVFPQQGTLFPTKIKIGTLAQAFYTVRNNTLEQRNGNFVKYFPPNVTQVVTPGPLNCGTTFDLAPFGQAGDSCILALNIVGPVNGSDPNPHHHLFVCFPGGLTCAGTNYPLNVSVITVVSIAVTPATASLFTGSTQQYTALATYSDGTTEDITNLVNWQSSNNAVAVITPNGHATAVGAGTTTITATFAGVTGTSTLTVSAITLVSIAIVPELANIDTTQTVQYTAIGTYTDGSSANLTNTVTWQSSNVAVATINANGLATGLDSGTTTITALLNGIISNAATLTVANPLILITVIPSAATINALQTQQFHAIGTFLNGDVADLTNQVTWSSSNTQVATISSTGLASGIAGGTVTIEAVSDGVPNTNAVLTVNNPLTHIEVTPATAAIVTSGTQQFIATGTYLNGQTMDITGLVTWNSSSPTVATITAGGLATGINAGSSNITATSGAITSNTAMLTVNVFLYVVNQSTITISYCTVNAAGTITGCLENSDALNTNPSEITINRNGTIAYVCNNITSKIIKCNINPTTGNLIDCVDTQVAIANPTQLAINPANTFAYVGSVAGVYDCPINATTGLLGPCVLDSGVAGAGIINVKGITINPPGTFAYMTIINPSTNIIAVCSVNSTTGTLFSCGDSGASHALIDAPIEIAVNPANTFVYWANKNTNTINACQINPISGALSPCAVVGGNPVPLGVTISTNNGILYFTRFTASNTVEYCPVLPSGLLGPCTTFASTFADSYGISITGHT